MPTTPAASLDDRQTVLAHFSLRHAGWTDRVSGASAAGFTGIGLFVGEYARLRDAGWTDAALLRVLADHDLRVIELEAAKFFATDFTLFDRVVETFHPERLQVVPPYAGPCDEDGAVAWLQHVADRYAPAGVTIAIEFLGCSVIDSAPAAVALARRAERPNVALCVDSWHVVRGRGLASLEGLDPAMVATIQIDDGPLQPVLPDYIPDCLHHRCPMGEGEFPLREFLAMLPAAAPLSVEVIDDDMDLLPTAEVAQRLYRSLVHTVT